MDSSKAQAPATPSESPASPPTAPPPVPGAPPKVKSLPASPGIAKEEKPKDARPAHDLAQAPEGELPADVTPHPQNDTAKAPAPLAKAPVGAPLPTVEYPQYKFAREVEHSPVTGGSAESRYLTVVYRLIKSHLHESPELHLDLANRHGIVDFYLDKGGTLVGRRLVSSSGSPNLDLAAMAAIAAAAPYPAPPNGHRSFNYNFGRSAQ
jgi:TonB family protein